MRPLCGWARQVGVDVSVDTGGQCRKDFICYESICHRFFSRCGTTFANLLEGVVSKDFGNAKDPVIRNWTYNLR